MVKKFYIALKLNTKQDVLDFSRNTGIALSRLNYYNDHNILPSGDDLEKILTYSNNSKMLLMLKMGIIDHNVIQLIQKKTDILIETTDRKEKIIQKKTYFPQFETRLGKMYQGDCLEILNSIENDSIDMVFADPPFNLNKTYPSKIDDNLEREAYIEWSQNWINECIRVLKHGGTFFLWNIPKWNIIFSNYISQFLTFKNWVTIDIKYSFPIKGKLYPSHYSLLYFIKGEQANTFNPDRLPLQICSKCFGDIKDYGGYKSKMNLQGVNLTDVWLDIAPVRHAKYKRRHGANELSLKLLDRIIEMSTNENDIILDPFGGSGTTYIAAELKNRKWIGCELGPIEVIKERFQLIDKEKQLLKGYREELNQLFTPKTKKMRLQYGHWIPENLTTRKKM